MAWLSDIFSSISKTFGEWFGNSDAQKPSSFVPEVTSNKAPISPETNLNENQKPIPEEALSVQQTASMNEVMKILKDCGVSGMPKHVGNLDISLPDSAYRENGLHNNNNGIEFGSLVALHNYLDSSVNQLAFNMGVQENINNQKSLEKFLLEHAKNIVNAVNPDSNLHYYMAQLAENLVNNRDTEPSKLFRNNLRDCLANYRLLETDLAQGVKLQADAGASYVPNTNVGGVVLGQVSIKFR